MPVSVEALHCPSSWAHWYKATVTDNKEVAVNTCGQKLQKIHWTFCSNYKQYSSALYAEQEKCHLP